MAKRYWVNMTMEIYVDEQGCGPRSTINENGDARWFADTIASKVPKMINKEFQFSEREYSVNDCSVNYLEN